MRVLITVLLGAGILLSGARAWASQVASDAPKASLQRSSALTAAPSATAAGQSGGSMDFDLLGKSQTAVEAPNVSALAGTRRFMLTAHQALGLGTLGLLTATVILGQLNYNDRFAPHAPGTGRFEQSHEILAITTLSAFGVTGLLALFAPDPYKKPLKLDTALIHKVCMTAATLGMAAELVLGLVTANREGFNNQAKFAEAHQIIGYTSLGFMAVGTGVWVF